MVVLMGGASGGNRDSARPMPATTPIPATPRNLMNDLRVVFFGGLSELNLNHVGNLNTMLDVDLHLLYPVAAWSALIKSQG